MNSIGWVLTGYIAGYIVGVMVTVCMGWPVVRYLRQELREAQDRLLGAWEQGKMIPPRSDTPLEMELPPLPPDLHAYVEEWESADSRLAVEATIRRMQAQGKTTAEIHNHFVTEQLRL